MYRPKGMMVQSKKKTIIEDYQNYVIKKQYNFKFVKTVSIQQATAKHYKNQCTKIVFILLVLNYIKYIFIMYIYF